MLTPLDPIEPTLIGINSDQQELDMIKKTVEKLNEDLIDSGFTQYQYAVAQRDNKVYIEQINPREDGTATLGWLLEAIKIQA